MSENSYEEYKKNLSRTQKKEYHFRGGRMCFLIGVGFLIYFLCIFPFHAVNVSEIRGNELKAGKPYGSEKVCYIDNLQILCAKPDADDELYCIAKFLDCDENEWIISFTPGANERLTQQIKLADYYEDELSVTISGYFHLKYLEDLPFAADSFFSVYGSSYADTDGRNMLSINAEYLCDKYDNYMSKILFRPGIPLGALVTGLVSVIYGGFSWSKNRPRKAASR